MLQDQNSVEIVDPAKDLKQHAQSEQGNYASEDVAQMVYLTNQVDNVLTTLKSKFENLSDEIMSRMDIMAERMDGLEKSLQEMLDESEPKGNAEQQAGDENMN